MCYREALIRGHTDRVFLPEREFLPREKESGQSRKLCLQFLYSILVRLWTDEGDAWHAPGRWREPSPPRTAALSRGRRHGLPEAANALGE